MGSATEAAKAIEYAQHVWELWTRVHCELDEGKEWNDIEHGVSHIQTKLLTYALWRAYMQQRLNLALHNILLSHRADNALEQRTIQKQES